MNKFKFKTNINCGNCVRSVTPFLNELDSVEHWEVDTEDPEKILTVEGEDGVIEEVIAALKTSGFDAVPVE